MVGAEDPLTIGQGALIKPDRLVQAPRRPVGVGEVVARSQGLRVVGAEDPLTIGQGALIKPDRL